MPAWRAWKEEEEEEEGDVDVDAVVVGVGVWDGDGDGRLCRFEVCVRFVYRLTGPSVLRRVLPDRTVVLDEEV